MQLLQLRVERLAIDADTGIAEAAGFRITFGQESDAPGQRYSGQHRADLQFSLPQNETNISAKGGIVIRLRTCMYSFLFVVGGMATVSAAEDMSEAKPHFIKIHESGSFGGKTWHEMDSKEFGAAVTAICTVFYDCGGLDAVALAAVHGTQTIVSGEDFSTSGVLHGPPPAGRLIPLTQGDL
jgi:hypothetical protein